MTNDLLPGTEVEARGLRWELVDTQPAGAQQRFRLRCLEGALRGEEMDFLVPLEKVEPIAKELDPTKGAGLAHWAIYHQAFLLEQALGPRALLAAPPGRLEIAPYPPAPAQTEMLFGQADPSPDEPADEPRRRPRRHPVLRPTPSTRPPTPTSSAPSKPAASSPAPTPNPSSPPTPPEPAPTSTASSRTAEPTNKAKPAAPSTSGYSRTDPCPRHR